MESGRGLTPSPQQTNHTKKEKDMEVGISKSKIYETCITTDYATAYLIMQMHKSCTMIHYNEDGKTIAYHLSWRKVEK